MDSGGQALGTARRRPGAARADPNCPSNPNLAGHRFFKPAENMQGDPQSHPGVQATGQQYLGWHRAGRSWPTECPLLACPLPWPHGDSLGRATPPPSSAEHGYVTHSRLTQSQGWGLSLLWAVPCPFPAGQSPDLGRSDQHMVHD